MPYRRKSSSRKSYSRPSYRKAPARRKTATRSPQTVKLVIEHRQASPVSRPDLQGLSLVERPSKKAKL